MDSVVFSPVPAPAWGARCLSGIAVRLNWNVGWHSRCRRPGASAEPTVPVQVLPEGDDVALDPVGEGAGSAAEDPLDIGADPLLGGVGLTDGIEGGLDHGLGH